MILAIKPCSILNRSLASLSGEALREDTLWTMEHSLEAEVRNLLLEELYPSAEIAGSLLLAKARGCEGTAGADERVQQRHQNAQDATPNMFYGSNTRSKKIAKKRGKSAFQKSTPVACAGLFVCVLHFGVERNASLSRAIVSSRCSVGCALGLYGDALYGTGEFKRAQSYYRQAVLRHRVSRAATSPRQPTVAFWTPLRLR